jgi:DNA-binding response OmpR family regulator
VRVQVVEDEIQMTRAIHRGLEQEFYMVDTALDTVPARRGSHPGPGAHTVGRAGQRVELSSREFALLEFPFRWPLIRMVRGVGYALDLA